MGLVELTNEQRRQVIDVDQAFTVWREAARKAVPGSLRWVTRKGVEYLYRKSGKSERSLWRRSKASEAIMSEHNQLRSRIRQTGARLKSMARVNRALYLNRVPKDAALVLRELDTAGLLGKHLFVIGTNALYAYEMKAAVLFESSLLATSDFDLLWDARERSRLLVAGMSPEGVIGVLRKADPTYSVAEDNGTRAQNARGHFVDLFCPDVTLVPNKLAPQDLDPIPTEGADWLIQAPKIEETVIGWDGMPLYMPCVDPRVFALHKLWLSKQPSRQERSRPRDIAQAKAVAAVATAWLRLKFTDRVLSRLPAALRAGATELARAERDLETFMMTLVPALNPHGVLTLRRVAEEATSEPERVARLEKAFDRGSGHGLLSLGADEVGTVLPPVLSYWREFGTRYVTALCALPGIGEGATKPPFRLRRTKELNKWPPRFRRWSARNT